MYGIKEILAKAHQMPLLSHSSMRLLELIGDKNHTLHEMAKIVETDSALTIKALKLVNSASFALREEISTVASAIPSDVVLDITKDLYGWMEEEDPAETIIQDALAELINTIAGRIMTRLIHEDISFELGLPDTGSHQHAPSDTAILYHFRINEQIFSLIMEGDFIQV